ncbi:MAG: preprotein translocase subunit SecG [Pseudomonadota bacterium]
MFTFLLVLQAVIAAVLVTLILMQRSEGGGLGVGGSSSGLMTARGQADFLTRATAFTAIAFVGLSILLAGLATTRQSTSTIDTSLIEESAPVSPIGDAPPAESVDNDILGSIAGQAEGSDADEEEAPAE